MTDEMLYDEAKQRLAKGRDELIPLELIERRIAGENRTKIWREHRGLTQEALAKRSEVSRPMIAAIESGHKTGGVGTLKKLAVALGVDVDDLV
jgi:DNA-binding XRE family transcriptional regulator